jgi:hypothetical protein
MMYRANHGFEGEIGVQNRVLECAKIYENY